MALLHSADRLHTMTARRSVRLNWRLLLALGGTACFWAVVAQGVTRLV